MIVSERAEALASAFESANNAVIAAVEGCSADQWKATCQEEGWPVAVAAHHVAATHESIMGLVQLVADGKETPPVTMEMIDAANAQHAHDFANVSRDETLAALKSNGAAVTSALRALSDEQLDRTAPMAFAGGQPWSAEQIIERVLIGHPLGHGASIKTTLG
jgi:hypothetical protein